MKAVYYFFCCIFLVGIYSSCSNSTKYQTEIKQLDSISLLLDSALLKAETIDTIKIAKQLLQNQNDLKSCEIYIKDTIDYETAIMLSEYKSSIKPFQTIIERYKSYLNDCLKSKKQILDLIHDLQIEKVNIEKVSEYVLDESIAASKAINNIEILVNLNNIYSEKYETYNSKVSLYIEQLKTKN